MFIPSFLLNKLYTKKTLSLSEEGFSFLIKNRLQNSNLIGIDTFEVNNQVIEKSKVSIIENEEKEIKGNEVSEEHPVLFPLKKVLKIKVHSTTLKEGDIVKVKFKINSSPQGVLKIEFEDILGGIEPLNNESKIPRNSEDDYQEKAIIERQDFVNSIVNNKLKHLYKYSFDPHICEGNTEHFIGVSQVPVGIAGPIEVNGEFAQGKFFIPLATTEGTLVASYNRGMKVLNECGGAFCTVSADFMQRSPVFVFDTARSAKLFAEWVSENFSKIKEQADSTSNYAKLAYIDPYLTNKFVFLRFNFKTGDAAGQNMAGKASLKACQWILDNYNYEIENFFLEGNISTDKKNSSINTLKTRGKRVTAEAVLKPNVLKELLRVDIKNLYKQSKVGGIGSFLTGSTNNGAHSANGITAMFIATGQDVANITESSSGILYTEMKENGDLYVSFTIPSLIVATYGGGTGLPTQKECLEIMNCYGKEKVKKLAEIVAATVLAGEVSLGASVASGEWVESHERYGRNR